MIIKDVQGNIIENPDLELGHLEDREEIIEHPAIEAQPRKVEKVLVDSKNGGKLYKEIVTPEVFARPAWTEVIKYKEYIPYTSEELAEREKLKAQEEFNRLEAEAKAEEDARLLAERNAIVDATPEALMELAATQEAHEDALVELAAMLAGEEE